MVIIVSVDTTLDDMERHQVLVRSHAQETRNRFVEVEQELLFTTYYSCTC